MRDYIIPLLCAYIGGALGTAFGRWHERKKRSRK